MLENRKDEGELVLDAGNEREKRDQTLNKRRVVKRRKMLGMLQRR